MRSFYGDLKIGILGGGQLGRMLIQEAVNFNINVSVLDPDADAPCKNLCERFVSGSLSDFQTVYSFGKTVDLLTIEIEKVSVDALEQLEKEGIQVFPQSRIIRLIQDKGLQKEFFKQNDIPTATYHLISSKKELNNSPLAYPYVQKLRRDGYDGRGVYKLQTDADIINSFDAPSIIEELIDFEKEIAVIVARNLSGEIKTFPCVEMDFHAHANLVEFLVSPSILPAEIQQTADKLAVKIAEKLGIVGLLAVEMFLTKDGKVLVNELAPRPHNSGHQSIEGNRTSQFAQHLRAILDLPLGDTSCNGYSVLVNLLGEKGCVGLAEYEGLNEILKIEGVYVHLYGKKITKPFRKMGHVTVVDEDREQAIEKAKLVKEVIKVKI